MSNMEITNEIKAKVFAQYLGQKFEAQRDLEDLGDIQVFAGDKFTLKLINYSDYLQMATEHDTESWNLGLVENGKFVYEYFNTDDWKLLLKPLSSIRDEDAIEAYHLYNYSKDEYNALAHAKPILNLMAEQAHVYQLLQSRGYDLPNYLLGGKTLQESGLAIYQ